MAANIGSGQPTHCALVLAREPYLLFNYKANQDYTVRVRYLTKNCGTNAAGDTEVLAIDNKEEIPLLPSEYHHLLILLIGKMLSGELKGVRNKDGSLRYPGMESAYAYYAEQYEMQLAKDLRHARRRTIDRRQAAFKFGGIENYVNEYGWH